MTPSWKCPRTPSRSGASSECPSMWRCLQTDARPPRLSPHHGRILRRKARPVRRMWHRCAPRLVTNLNDEYGVKFADFSRKRSSVVLTYGWQRGDFHAEKTNVAPHGTRFDMVTPREKIAIFSPLIGRVNVYNILAASAACFARGAIRKRSRRHRLVHHVPEDSSALTAASPSPSSSTMRTPTMPSAI